MVDLTPSQENYLKTVYIKASQNGYAKMSDIADLLRVKKSSVNGALNILTDKGLINYVPYSQITLTVAGLAKAEEIMKKFDVMIGFFSNILKLSKEEASANSCRIEHVMSEELFNKMSKFCKFMGGFFADNPDCRKQLDDFLSPPHQHKNK
ncbi:MAG: metal-dependent transcriptional regulator [Holosporaceae bacterium]|jgi:DtxR family Mn-dependent transcriptional regulator|nr:metal-dependent transcriptional regulator [Holosporaceae bacterium]